MLLGAIPVAAAAPTVGAAAFTGNLDEHFPVAGDIAIMIYLRAIHIMIQPILDAALFAYAGLALPSAPSWSSGLPVKNPLNLNAFIAQAVYI